MLKEILEQQPPAGDLPAPHDKISPQDKKLELSPTKHLRGRKELRDAATYIQASSRESSPGAGREVMNCCMNCGVSFFIYEDGQGKSLQFCSKGTLHIVIVGIKWKTYNDTQTVRSARS